MRAWPTISSLLASILRARSSANGASGSVWPGSPAWRRSLGAGGRPAFPPSLVVQVKALACEWPHRKGLPLSRFHTPIHASWLNQVEIYFSIVQRKVLTPNDFDSLAELEAALLAFQNRYERSAASFQWTFTRENLAKLMNRLNARALAPPPDASPEIRHRNSEQEYLGSVWHELPFRQDSGVTHGDSRRSWASEANVCRLPRSL